MKSEELTMNSDLTNEARAVIAQIDSTAGALRRMRTKAEAMLTQPPRDVEAARGLDEGDQLIHKRVPPPKGALPCEQRDVFGGGTLDRPRRLPDSSCLPGWPALPTGLAGDEPALPLHGPLMRSPLLRTNCTTLDQKVQPFQR